MLIAKNVQMKCMAQCAYYVKMKKNLKFLASEKGNTFFSI